MDGTMSTIDLDVLCHMDVGIPLASGLSSVLVVHEIACERSESHDKLRNWDDLSVMLFVADPLCPRNKERGYQINTLFPATTGYTPDDKRSRPRSRYTMSD